MRITKYCYVQQILLCFTESWNYFDVGIQCRKTNFQLLSVRGVAMRAFEAIPITMKYLETAHRNPKSYYSCFTKTVYVYGINI